MCAIQGAEPVFGRYPRTNRDGTDAPCSDMVRVPPLRYAGVVFNVRLKQPQSIAGRTWNRAMDVSPIVPLTFVVLKLSGVITWSWWWVLSPLWISGAALALLVGSLVILWCLGLFRSAAPKAPRH